MAKPGSAEFLLTVREDVRTELVRAVLRGEKPPELKRYARLVVQLDERLEKLGHDGPRPALARRMELYATRSREKRTVG